MGIRGLARYVNDKGILKEYDIFNTKLIVDGNNILHWLYSKINCSYGGEYNRFGSRIQEFFSILKECNIEPIVVFDGGSELLNSNDTSIDDKLNKQLKRINTHLGYVKDLLYNRKGNNIILPLNAYEMFRYVLRDMDIQFCQCDYECDNQIAGLSEHFKCPILSEDSDFYIYDLQYGVIKVSHLEETILRKKIKRVETKYLKCKIYYVKNFVKCTKLKKEYLSLFAILASCDELESFRSTINAKGRDTLMRILTWLTYSYKNVQQVVNMLESAKRNKAERLLLNATENYQSKLENVIDVLKYKNDTKDEYNLEAVLNPPMITICGTNLPKEFVIAFRSGNLPAFLLNVLTLHRQFLTPQIEDLEKPSSYECSKFIRQVIYGVLLQHDKEDSDHDRHSNLCLKKIEEYDRKIDKINPNQVEFIDKVKNMQVPKLIDIYSMENIDKQNFMAAVLDVDINFFQDIPEHLKLYLGCILYWCKFCKPKLPIVYALILCPEYIQLKEQHSNFNQEEYDDSPDLNIVHSFTQFQTCFLYVNVLNVLLNMPFDSSNIHKLVSGILLHNLTQQLKMYENLDLGIENLLKENADILGRFKMYKNEIHQYLPSVMLSKKRKTEVNDSKISNKRH